MLRGGRIRAWFGVARMNAWLASAIALMPPLAMPIYVGLRARSANRLVAVMFAGTLTALILVLMSFAFAQPSFVDLALALSLLSLPGTLVMARFLERWL